MSGSGWGSLEMTNNDNTPPHEGDDEAPELRPEIQALLGQQLKAHYDDLIQAPMPDRILLLLAQLEAKERSEDGTSGDGR